MPTLGSPSETGASCVPCKAWVSWARLTWTENVHGSSKKARRAPEYEKPQPLAVPASMGDREVHQQAPPSASAAQKCLPCSSHTPKFQPCSPIPFVGTTQASSTKPRAARPSWLPVPLRHTTWAIIKQSNARATKLQRQARGLANVKKINNSAT